MNLFYLAQIFGLLIFIFEILTITSNKKKKALLYNTIVNVFSVLQYVCLQAYTGVLGILVTFIRNYILNKYQTKKKKAPIYWLIIMIILLIIANYTAYDGIISCIPILTIGLYTIALWQDNMNSFRLLNMFICFLSAIYNFHYGAYVGFISQIIFILVCAGSYTYNINDDKKKKKKKRKTN